jgi:uncharacterized membrane protein
MALAISLSSLSLSAVFFFMWLRLWKDYDSLRIEYGRLWNELKQLERRNENEIL